MARAFLFVLDSFGVGGARDIAIVEAEGQLFLAPDNGLLAGVIERLTSPPTLRRLDAAILPALGVHRPSATFHGRDIFAPLAAELAAGRLLPAGLGPEVDEIVPGWLEEHVANAVLQMAKLPLEANIQFMTLMATKMPYIGRG